MIRDGARAALWQWREVIAAGVVAALGLWVATGGGWVLVPFGLLVAAFGAGLAVQGWRRMRFAQGRVSRQGTADSQPLRLRPPGT